MKRELPSEDCLVSLCEAYCRATGLSESRVGTLAAANPNFFQRLDLGGSCTIRLYRRIVTWFSGHWPEDATWPPDVPRPEPTPRERAA